MSVVTNVMLTFSIGEADYETEDGKYGHPVVDKINEWLGCPNGLKNIGKHAGGDKEMETDVYVGAFNYLNIDGLRAIVTMQDWISPLDVQLYIQGQEAETFTEYRAVL